MNEKSSQHLDRIAEIFVEARKQPDQQDEIQETDTLIERIVAESKNPKVTAGEILQKILSLLNPSSRADTQIVLDATRVVMTAVVNVLKRTNSPATITESSTPRSEKSEEQEEFGTWDPPLRVSSLVEKRLNKNFDGDAQVQVYHLLQEKHGPMSTEEALSRMSKHLELSREDVLARFPDLDGFEGEIYFDFNMTNIQIGGTSLEIHGGKDGRQVFVLDCTAYENGWFPATRNGREIIY